MGTSLYDSQSLGRTRRAANATRSATVSALVRKSRYITKHRCSPILTFLSPPSCFRAATPPTGAAKRRESRRPIILRLVLFCFARIGEISEQIVIIRLYKHNCSHFYSPLFFLLYFFPVFTTMSSTSGEVPADRSVVGSSGGDAAAEVSHIIFANDYFLF